MEGRHGQYHRCVNSCCRSGGQASRSLGILVELGFKPLANPLMRNTVGRKVSLKQGSKLEGTPMDKIVRTLEANGYEVIGLD